MEQTTYCKPRDPSTATRHLFVGNCGPALGIDASALRDLFSPYGTVERVHLADAQSGSFAYISFDTVDAASAALAALNGAVPPAANRPLAVRYADVQLPKARHALLPCAFS